MQYGAEEFEFLYLCWLKSCQLLLKYISIAVSRDYLNALIMFGLKQMLFLPLVVLVVDVHGFRKRAADDVTLQAEKNGGGQDLNGGELRR